MTDFDHDLDDLDGLLHDAIVTYQHDAVLALLEAGADVHARSMPRWRTPLHDAAEVGHTAAVLTLIAWGAEIDAGDRDGVTPLGLAVINGNAMTIEALIASGADHEAEDSSGRTTLALAAIHGLVGPVERLLKHGSDPARVLDHASFKAMLASAPGRFEAMKALLLWGLAAQRDALRGLAKAVVKDEGVRRARL